MTFPQDIARGTFFGRQRVFCFWYVDIKDQLTEVTVEELFGSQEAIIWFSGRTLLRVCIGIRLIIIDNYLVLGENSASCLHWISFDHYRQLFGSRGEHCFEFALDFV